MNNMFLPGFLILEADIGPKDSTSYGGGTGESFSGGILQNTETGEFAYYFGADNEYGLTEPGYYIDVDGQWVLLTSTEGWIEYNNP